ncbi:unnamed protein product [Anisakis simplex]|uniref:Uncharacterized protein n=1 Tax=Anisakis simplex TaxID=6269 RepID=A0A3P6Q5S8_ANISI|nr:unnamed protein product [Anisakis simplex]
MINENVQLSEKVEEQLLRINELEGDVSLLRKTIDSLEEESRKAFDAMEQMSKEVEEKTAEVQAANMAICRLQVCGQHYYFLLQFFCLSLIFQLSQKIFIDDDRISKN